MTFRGLASGAVCVSLLLSSCASEEQQTDLQVASRKAHFVGYSAAGNPMFFVGKYGPGFPGPKGRVRAFTLEQLKAIPASQYPQPTFNDKDLVLSRLCRFDGYPDFRFVENKFNGEYTLIGSKYGSSYRPTFDQISECTK